MNYEVNYKDNNKQTTKELCEYFDKEDGLPLGTNYQQHKACIAISVAIMILLVSLGLYSLIK